MPPRPKYARARKPEFEVGDILHITFYDHSAGKGVRTDTGVIEFQMVGMVIKFDEHGIDMAWWTNSDGTHDHNTEFVSIARGAITKLRRLK